MTVNGRAYAVLGVASRDFSRLDLERIPDVYLPLATYFEGGPHPTDLLQRNSAWLGVLGRLEESGSVSRAETGVSRAAQRSSSSRAADFRRMEAHVDRLHGWIPAGHAGDVLPLAAIGFAASGLVLLVSAANVANLLLGKSIARRREIAVRTALGASRNRLIRLPLTESALLSVAAALAALAISSWGVPLLLERLATPPGIRAVVDGNVLLFSLSIAVATGLLFGLAPTLSATRRNLAGFFQTQRGEPPSQTRAQRALVVAQVALSLLLLSIAGLFLRSLQKAASVDIGLDRPGARAILAVSFDLDTQNYEGAAADRFHRELLRRAEALPGVSSAALTEVLPLSGRAIGDGVRPAGKGPATETAQATAFLNSVSPGYFSTLGIPLLAGREFSFTDDATNPRVVIVNERLAALFWPRQNPIGKQLLVGNDTHRAEIVGVARDGRYESFTERPLPFLYFPILQHRSGFGETVLLTKSTTDAARLLPVVRETVRSLDAGLPLFHAGTLAESLEARLDDRAHGAFVISLLGAAALALAAAGLYSVISYSVARRSQEIGIRMALGATRRSVVRLFLTRGASLAATGIAIGLLLSLALTRLLTRMLFGIEPTDALTFAAVAAGLTAVAMAASWIPALRAARLDPTEVLRME